jgi:lipoprotein-releasing system ATP-binding protein
MIELKLIDKSYGNQKILDKISLNIKKGEFISIVGPSGAGKTTLLNIIGTIEDFDKSEKSKFLINSQDLTKLSDKDLSKFRNENIGFVFQFHQLLPELTVEENILLPTMIKGDEKDSSDKYFIELISILGIDGILNKYPNSISGGERQRAAVARAMINKPSILLADEPTGNLDSKNEEEIISLFKKVNKDLGVTIILVTHNDNFSKLADKCFTLRDGKWSK